MKAKIEEYERLHKETEDLKESLDKIFEKAFNYLRGKFLYVIDDEDKRKFALFEFWVLLNMMALDEKMII